MSFKPLVLSHSLRKLGHSCWRKFEFSVTYSAEDFEAGFAAEVGKAMHLGIQDYLLTGSEERGIFAFLAAFPYEMEFQDDGSNPYYKSQRGLEPCLAALQKLFEMPILRDYELVIITTEQGPLPAVEIPFAILLKGTGLQMPVYYMGHIDLILRHKVTGEICVFDIKTTRNKGYMEEERYRFDQQVIPYSLIIAPAIGIESISELNVYYLPVYIDLIEPDVRLHLEFHGPEMMQDWARGLAHDLQQIKKFQQDQWWPRPVGGETCVGFGKKCPFLEFCKFREPAMLRQMLPERELSDFYNPEKAWLHGELDMTEVMK